MKEREKCKKTSHHRPQCAKCFSRYSISKSGIWARWTSPFCRFSVSFSIKYDVTDAILQDNEKMKVQYPGGHSITKRTGGLARRSDSKTPNYLSKNSNIKKMLKSYPLKFLRYSPKAQRSAIWDKFSFSLRIVPLTIRMNHFSYPLTIV